MRLKVGDTAPLFELPDQNGKTHKLAEYRGRKVLSYFYPKDGTSGCTTEACQIRDHFPKFEGTKVAVLGISTDSPESHKKFSQKYKLPFTMLADTNKEADNTYD